MDMMVDDLSGVERNRLNLADVAQTRPVPRSSAA
jgi:hypothetical protein